MEISSGFFIFWEGMGRFGFGHFDGVYPPQVGSVTALRRSLYDEGGLNDRA
jgi:hypothetical protein